MTYAENMQDNSSLPAWGVRVEMTAKLWSDPAGIVTPRMGSAG